MIDALAEPFDAALELRVFSSPRGGPHYRRATDVLLLVPAMVGIVALVLAYPPGPLERSVVSLLAAIPDWLSPVASFFYDLLALAAVLALASALVARRWFVLAQTLASLVLSVLAALGAARLALGHRPNLEHILASGTRAPDFPGVRLAVVATVLLAISPHLVQPLQRVDRWLLFLGFTGALVVDGTSPSGNLAGLLIAVVGAAGGRLVFGTSAGRPSATDIEASLAELRVTARGLRPDERQQAGVVVFRGTDRDREELLVKVHGRDAYDNQLLEKLWRLLWHADGGPSLRLGRRDAVEHEGLATLLARTAGVRTHEVLRAGTTARGDAVLVLRGQDRRLTSATGEQVWECWRALDRLHGANIAHRRLDTWTVAHVDGQLGFVDFASATTTPTPDQLATDRAQLLVTTAALAGSSTALRSALDVLGRDGLARLLPYLQRAALESELQQATEASGIDVDDLRKEAAALVGQEEPGLVRLRRVTWRSLVQAGLLILAAFAVLSFATGIDYDQFVDGLSDATWSWIAVGFIVAQTPRVSQAVATLGSVAADLRFGPVYAMQLATGYMNLALPSVAGRLAVNIRFFQRQGITPAAAVTSGAIDSFASTVVQAVLLTLLLLFSESTLDLQLESPSSRVLATIAILAALVVAAIAAAALVRRLRTAVIDRVRRWWPEARAALAALRSSNKLALLLTGSIATEVLFAATLGLFALGLGTRIGITDLLVINLSISLFASLIPIPGGIGVTELGLTVGLTTAGMSEEAALATALLYRVAVFYLPPVWGFFALRWLQRNQYL
jgi:uncharacterized membrane protein YbhN (UPF0104 family)